MKMKAVAVYQRTLGLLFHVFIFLVFYQRAVNSISDQTTPCDSSNAIHSLLRNRWKDLGFPEFESKEASAFYGEFYKVYIADRKITDETQQPVFQFIFENLKNEFDVASCIFRGVAMAGGIEKAAIYLHTTKYVFTSLRYTLEMYKNTKYEGKMERELAPFAILLNSVLLHWKELKHITTEITFSAETYMCDDLKDLENEKDIDFPTFMPSSTDLKVAQKYAEKKGPASCIYIFKNKKSEYSPRIIDILSYEPEDKEAVYPLGAAFKKFNCKDDTEIDKIYKNIVSDESKNWKNIVCLRLF